MFTKVATVTVLLLSNCVALAQGRDGNVLEQADTDHDGQVTRLEFKDARAAQFTRLDRNGDGVVDDTDSGERADRPQAGQRAAAIRARMDANGDGKISKDEFVGAPTLLFDQFDADRNDVLDAKELEAARNGAKERLRKRREQ